MFVKNRDLSFACFPNLLLNSCLKYTSPMVLARSLIFSGLANKAPLFFSGDLIAWTTKWLWWQWRQAQENGWVSFTAGLSKRWDAYSTRIHKTNFGDGVKELQKSKPPSCIQLYHIIFCIHIRNEVGAVAAETYVIKTDIDPAADE